jgi:hypothetical protein
MAATATARHFISARPLPPAGRCQFGSGRLGHRRRPAIAGRSAASSARRVSVGYGRGWDYDELSDYRYGRRVFDGRRLSGGREIRNDIRDVHQARQELREDQQQLQKNRNELARDRAELRRDILTGANKKEIRQDRREIRQDRQKIAGSKNSERENKPTRSTGILRRPAGDNLPTEGPNHARAGQAAHHPPIPVPKGNWSTGLTLVRASAITMPAR